MRLSPWKLGRPAALVAVAVAPHLAACQGETKKEAPPAPVALPPALPKQADGAVAINPRLLRRFQPLAERSDVGAGDPSAAAKVELGRSLFYETRLSRDADLSCNSCHDLAAYGVDGEKTSVGHRGQLGRRNAPTVYNAAGAFAQFWDGRAKDVEEQAKAPIVNPVEMAMSDGAAVVARLEAIPSYVTAFAKAFPSEKKPITFDNVGKAIGAFERRLATPGRWDRFLRGDKNALTEHEKEGLKTFVDVGCMVCHTGVLVGGSMFERVGVVEPWPNQEDHGRGEITKNAAEVMMFKVPSLRNVAKSAPYFHDGSAATLADAVRMMGRHQLGLELAPHEVDAISAWLESLTGELPLETIAKPKVL